MSKSIVQHEDGDLVMRQRVEDGYINLNDIARSTNKRLDKWLANKSTQDLFSEFEKQQLNTPNSGYLNRAILTTRGREGSTWAHPEIAIQFAQWCSPAFALWCSRIIMNYMMNGAGNPLWHQNRKQLKDSNYKLREAVKRYVDRHPELSDKNKKYIFGNVNIHLAIAIVGCAPAKFRKDNKTNTFREALNKDQLRDLELLESVVIKLVDKDIYPLDAIANAKERLMITM